MMKRTLRSALAVGLAVLLGVPLSAQQSTLRLPPPEPAAKGQEVVVTTRDGREITGAIGNWIDDVGFHVRPDDGKVWLIHPQDIVSMNDARTGRQLYPPLRRGPNRITTANAVMIGVLATIGGILLLGRLMTPIG